MNALPAWFTGGPVRQVLDLLNQGGEEARPVGGAVRNWLIGLPPGDIDIATTLSPQAVTARAEAAGWRVVPTGIDHGTVTLVLDGLPLEVTTLREDVATDGRHAVVRFGRDWREDAARRDFTFNAMSLTSDGGLCDPFGGAADLAAGRVRFIGEAMQRIREDRLRILRFFRFHAAYGRGEPDKAGLAACVAERNGLEALSRERVRTELMRLLVQRGAAEALAAMAEAGLLHRVLGGVPLVPHLARMVAIETALGLDPDPVRRLAAMAVLVLEDALRLRERLALSNTELRRLETIGSGWHGFDPRHGALVAKAQLHAAGPRGYRDRALVAFARSGAEAADSAWKDLISLPERWSAPAFPVSGDDLVRRGLVPGPELGRRLQAIRMAWIGAGFPVSRDEVDRLVERALGEGAG